MTNQRIYQYKNTLVKFINEIYEQFPEEGELLLIKFCLEKLPATISFNMFNTLLHKNEGKVKHMIKERNHDFFFHCNNLGFYGKNKMKYFYDIWRSERVDEDTRSIIWDWIDALVEIIDKHNNEKLNK